jgi:hypothetical protein
MVHTGATVLNLTAALPVDITTEFDSLGATIVCTHLTIEEL